MRKVLSLVLSSLFLLNPVFAEGEAERDALSEEARLNLIQLSVSLNALKSKYEQTDIKTVDVAALEYQSKTAAAMVGLGQGLVGLAGATSAVAIGLGTVPVSVALLEKLGVQTMGVEAASAKYFNGSARASMSAGVSFVVGIILADSFASRAGSLDAKTKESIKNQLNQVTSPQIEIFAKLAKWDLDTQRRFEEVVAEAAFEDVLKQLKIVPSAESKVIRHDVNFLGLMESKKFASRELCASIRKTQEQLATLSGFGKKPEVDLYANKMNGYYLGSASYQSNDTPTPQYHPGAQSLGGNSQPSPNYHPSAFPTKTPEPEKKIKNPQIAQFVKNSSKEEIAALLAITEILIKDSQRALEGLSGAAKNDLQKVITEAQESLEVLRTVNQ